jgi:hypothetical protein
LDCWTRFGRCDSEGNADLITGFGATINLVKSFRTTTLALKQTSFPSAEFAAKKHTTPQAVGDGTTPVAQK